MKKNICVIMMLIVFVFMTGCSAKDIQAIYDDNQRISSTSNTYNLINSNSEIKGQQITGEFEKMEGMDTVQGTTTIHSFIPLSEMFGYATDLRSKTQGRGVYAMEPSHYEEVPKSVLETIVASRKKAE